LDYVLYNDSLFGLDPVAGDVAFKAKENIGALSPRIALSYTPVDDHTVSLSYQKGFRTPDAVYFKYRYYFSKLAEQYGGNMPYNLNPEEMHSFDLNYHARLFADKLGITVNGYYNVFDGMIYWATRDKSLPQSVIDSLIKKAGWFGCFVNAEESFNSIGGEVKATYKPMSWLEVEPSYSISYPMNLDEKLGIEMGLLGKDSTGWSRYPSHIVKLRLQTKLFDEKLGIDLSPYYTSGIKAIMHKAVTQYYGDEQPYEKNRVIMNGAISYSFTENAMVKLDATNIFAHLGSTKVGDNPLGSDIPPYAFDLKGGLYSGGLGFDQTKVHLTLGLRF
jgi:hypothetical protein